jgi:hypothetical protein
VQGAGVVKPDTVDTVGVGLGSLGVEVHKKVAHLIALEMHIDTAGLGDIEILGEMVCTTVVFGHHLAAVQMLTVDFVAGQVEVAEGEDSRISDCSVEEAVAQVRFGMQAQAGQPEWLADLLQEAEEGEEGHFLCDLAHGSQETVSGWSQFVLEEGGEVVPSSRQIFGRLDGPW